MKAFIIQFPFGLIAFDEENYVIGKTLFPKKPQAAAKQLTQLESGKLPDEAATMISTLENSGYDTFVFENATLAQNAQTRLNVKTETVNPAETEKLRSRMEQVAVETGFVKDAKELSMWTHNVSMEITKMRVKGAVEKRDLIVGQTILTLDDLDRTLNLFMGRLREWYGVHFPELDRLVDKHETYARLVTDLGAKENFTAETLEKEDLPKAKAEQISQVAERSMGADIDEKDLAPIQTLSADILTLYDLRKNIESYLEKTMEEVAPNIKTIVGALLGARLIATAGSLQNLAMRPASTIQVLGAEKALFRSLKTGARPPKHGLIFQHALLHDAKWWQRGKIARALAGKLTIAARADAFGGRYVGDKLKADLDRRIEEIREKYKEPPPVKERKPAPEREERPERREWREERGRRREGPRRPGFGRPGGRFEGRPPRRDQRWRDRRDRNRGERGGSSGSER